MNALIRIYSRLVSSAFLLFSCAACFLLPNLRGAVMQLCVVAAYLFLFQTYQDKLSMGKTFYAFIFFGIASMAYIHILCFIPFIWLLMGTNLLSLSWRTWCASVLGLLTPYWLGCSWLIWQGDLTIFIEHITSLTDFEFPVNYTRVGIGFMTTLALFILATITGIVHYLRKSFNDKIRIRMLYGFFIWMNLLAITFVCLQPQRYDMLLRLIIINTAPLIAHFLALTSTRATNVAFYLITAATLLITAYNVWTTSYLF